MRHREQQSARKDRQRLVRAECHEDYRSNANEDRQGYQILGQRGEFESRRRQRQDDTGKNFEAQDNGQGCGSRDQENDSNDGTLDDYSRTDYGSRRYGPRADAASGTQTASPSEAKAANAHPSRRHS